MANVLRVGCVLVMLAGWVTVLVFWHRSNRVVDEWTAVDGGNTLRAAVSFRGSLHLIRAQKNSTKRPWAWDVTDVPKGATWRELHFGRTVLWERHGFMRLAYVAPPPPPAPPAPPIASRTGARAVAGRRVAPPPWGSAVSPWLLTQPYDAWVIPYRALLAVFSSLPLLFLTGFARRTYRRARGRCARCAYDLRGSRERCPECGTKLPRSIVGTPPAAANAG